jgi:hypothetical protein
MRSSFFQSVRFPASIGVLFLSWFLFGEARDVWKHYWLLKDGEQGTGIVTYEHARNVVDYCYRVGGKEYKGTDRRRYLRESHEYVNVMLGGHAVVYFSCSHPWLSSLTPPASILPDGFLGVLLFLAFEIWLIITLISPNNRWAYKLPHRPTA